MTTEPNYIDPGFIHLRLHSSYSLAEGAITPDAIVQQCKKHRMPAVAVTDSGNLFCALEFSLTTSGAGIQPIIGVEMRVNIAQLEAKKNGQYTLPTMVLLASNEVGYHNLLKLVSLSFLETKDHQPTHIEYDSLLEHHEGIILLSGADTGPFAELYLNKKETEATQLLSRTKEIFGDRFYMELMRHGTERQQILEPIFLQWACDFQIPLVATNNVFFTSLDMHQAHDILLCISDGRYVTEDDRRKLSQEHFFKSPRQMRELFADIPEAIENTVNIAKRCAVMAHKCDPLLPHFDCEGGRDEAEELTAQAKEGLLERLETKVFTPNIENEEKEKLTKNYMERLEYELGIIISMQFPGYFLIVSDFIKWGKHQGIPIGPGRGSGAGSMVAWALQITDLDPIRFGLLFERFLNPERVSMPDFDIDFCQERREEVIQYVQEKYGRDKVAQIITFGKLQAKAVLRDVGRVLQMPYNQVDRISKMIPFNPLDPITLQKALDMDRDLRKMRDEDPEIRHLMDISQKLEGLNRHASTHAAGVVIGDRPLHELVPLYRDPRSDMPVSGYSMKYTEAAGLVKFDFLGLKTLTVVAKTCEFIEQHKQPLDINTIPLDDPATYELLAKGDSVGVFQLESAGMRDTLKKLRPDTIDDIIALISLYRPGPMDNIPSYIARKHGKEEPDYLDPMLNDILEETYGVIIYQEQVMQIAQVMGGYTLGGADLLRRAMGKKIASEMDLQRKIFVEGAIKNGVSESKASSIFDLVAKFAGYGFNKSHAAAYSMISYQTAYLKANYIVEFLAASMNLDINDTDKISIFRQEILRHDIEILPPDINASEALFAPEERNGALAVRYGLGALKNVGAAAMQQLVNEREGNGAFKDIFDFVERVGQGVLNKRQMENLVRSGAFDSITPERATLFENLEMLLKHGSMASQERNSAQNSLFAAQDDVEPRPALIPAKPWTKNRMLDEEFAAVGFYLTTHPLEAHEASLKQKQVLYASDFETRIAEGSSKVKVAGVVTSKKIKSSARGRFAILNFSDPTGLFEVSIFNENLIAQYRDYLEPGNLLLVSANARKDEGSIRLMVDEMQPIDSLNSNQTWTLNVVFECTKSIAQFKKILEESGKGSTRIHLSVQHNGHMININIPDQFAIQPDSTDDIKAIEGIKKLEFV